MAKRQINIDALPSNNIASSNEPAVEKITKGRVKIQGKKSVKAASWFRDIADGLVAEVVVPTIKNMITEFVQSGIEQIVYGNSSHRRSSFSGRRAGYTNYTTYGSSVQHVNARRVSSARAMDLDLFWFSTKQDADAVLSHLFQDLVKYQQVSVGRYYALVGKTPNQIHYGWGWTNLDGSRVQLTQDGYQILLPEPDPLD